MRRISHPGPEAPDRAIVCSSRVDRVRLALKEGTTLLEAVSQALPVDARSAVLRLCGGEFSRLPYFHPALSPTERHAVFYSNLRESAAPAALREATMTYGVRHGASWLHCHALWSDVHGTVVCGHVDPTATLAEPMEAEAWILKDVKFDVLEDQETNFSLFQPTTLREVEADDMSALVVRLSPNVDVCVAIEDICLARGITAADIRGGVGSTVGAVFDDGRTVEPFITELLVSSGCVASAENGEVRASIDVAMVDYTGTVSRGRLLRGQNPVLVTFELVIVPRTPVGAHHQ